MWNNTERRYSKMVITLHWLMLLLLAAVYACIELHGSFPKGSATREALKNWHFMLGLSVLLLVVVRLLLRFIAGPRPAIRPAPPLWQERLARLVQFLLYALMIGMPLAGWMALSAGGKPVPFFGWEWPALLGPDKALASRIKGVHEWVGTAGYWLIGLHTLAALFHHYWLRDNTLAQMLPLLRARGDAGRR